MSDLAALLTTPADIRTAVKALRADHGDFEAAHAAEDAIHVKALQAIAAGAAWAPEIATEALKTSEIEFQRPCA